MKTLLIKVALIASWAASSSSAEVVEKIVAIVNDEVVLKTDISQFVSNVKKGGIIDDLITEDPKALLSDRAKTIQHLIDEKVIENEVKKKNLQVTFEQVEKEISKIAGRNGITKAQLKEALKEQGTVFSDYQDFIKKRLERQSLIEQSVTSKIKITDDEIVQYYVQNNTAKGTLIKSAFEYRLAHILFVKEGGLTSTPQKKAERSLERIAGGESFESVASKFSEDPNYSTGGLLGTFRSGEFLKELEDAAKNLEPGGISKPVVTRSGVHILKVLEKKIIPDPKIEAEKERIRQVLYQQAFKRQFAFWLDQRRREYFIRINSSEPPSKN